MDRKLGQSDHGILVRRSGIRLSEITSRRRCCDWTRRRKRQRLLLSRFSAVDPVRPVLQDPSLAQAPRGGFAQLCLAPQCKVSLPSPTGEGAGRERWQGWSKLPPRAPPSADLPTPPSFEPLPRPWCTFKRGPIHSCPSTTNAFFVLVLTTSNYQSPPFANLDRRHHPGPCSSSDNTTSVRELSKRLTMPEFQLSAQLKGHDGDVSAL